MFKKVFEDQFNNNFIKGYELDKDSDILGVIKIFQDLNIVINNVYVDEDADLGMKSFQGNYSLDKFLMIYNQHKNNIESVILTLNDNNRIYIDKKNYISLSSASDIELDDILNKSKSL